MGRVIDRFGEVQFHNEADVSQSFLVPLLSDFLGYARQEILPERVIPAFDIPQNRQRSLSSSSLPATAKPDYIVAIDGREKVLVCDSKGPEEDLGDHLDQLKAYCIGLGLNLLLITNGTQLRVYDANELVLKCMTVTQLDLSFDELKKLLHRSNAVRYSSVQRIQSLDLPRSLSMESDQINTARRREVALALSDFRSYLETVSQWQIVTDFPPGIRDAFVMDLPPLPPEQLFVFRELGNPLSDRGEEGSISYDTLLHGEMGVPVLLAGESGIGKTSLLRRLVSDRAHMCLACESDRVPVLVKLGHYTRTRSLLQMIDESLNSRGSGVTSTQLVALLREGRLVIFLDAFDEVVDASRLELDREMQALLDNYAGNDILITTRHFRMPTVAPVRPYQVEPLSRERIQAFAHEYLGLKSSQFLQEVSRKGLANVASNTLLLTLMILLYRRNGDLPVSRGAILREVLLRVTEWNRHKQPRLSSAISEKVQRELLERLAFAALCQGEAYSLQMDLAESVLNDALCDLERRRLVPGGLALSEILDVLAAPGFVRSVDGAVIFWHRAFLEYFAAAEVARRCEAAPELLAGWACTPEWESVLPLAVARSDHREAFASDLSTHNIFLGAQGLIECGMVQGETHQHVAGLLVERCQSQNVLIRQLALGLLRQLQGDYINALLPSLLGSCHTDVQQGALVELARRGLPGSREAVFARRDWNPLAGPVMLWTGLPSPGAAVIEALGELGDPEALLEAVHIWRDRQDVFTDESCRDVLLRAASRVPLGSRIAHALLDVLLGDSAGVWHKHSGIGEVLSVLGDPAVVSPLIAALKTARRNEHVSRDMAISGVLACYRGAQVLDELANCATDTGLDDYPRSWFAEALSTSRADVPQAVLTGLASHGSPEIRAHAMRGLTRFPFEEVGAIVLQALHTLPEDDAGYEYADALLQEAALRVLASHRRVELLLEAEHTPKYFFYTSLEVLFAAISSQSLQSMIPFLQRLVARVRDRRIAIKAAWVLADLGCTGDAQSIVERQLHEGLRDHWVAHDILEGVHRLPARYALGVVDEIKRRRDEIASEHSGLLESLSIDALTRVGTHEACQRLAAVVLSGVERNSGVTAEEALRGIEVLAPRGLEEPLKRLVMEHRDMPDYVLRRALETLGIIGGEGSLSLLREHLVGSQAEETRLASFRAIQSIYRRAGRLWYDGEEIGRPVEAA